MNYVSIACDLIQIVCWFIVIYCFNRLFREKRNLSRDNAIMKSALIDIACVKVPDCLVFDDEEEFLKYSRTMFGLWDNINEIQSKASEAIKRMVEEEEE